MALRFVDICIEWNELIGNDIGIPIDISDIPTDWGFDATYIYIAPVAGTFGGIPYRQGFWIDSGFNMFGLSVLVNIEVEFLCLCSYSHPQVTTDNFDFHVEINTTEFQINLQHELDLESTPGI